MINRKPETTLHEDLAFLGLAPKNISEDEAADKVMAAKPEEKKEEPKAEKPEDKDDEAEEKEEKKEAPAKEMPAFLQKKAEEAAEADFTARLEAAWDVVRSYYTMSESDDKELTNEDLRTVIDAYAFICEAQFNSGEPTKKPDGNPGENADMFPDGENPLTQKATANSPTAPEWKKDKYGERGRAKSDKSPASPYHRMAQVKTEAAAALVADLVAIRDAISESGPSAETLALAESLFEGFEAVRASASQVAARIGAELSEEKEVAEDDARAKAFEYFDGIASDASEILKGLAEGTVEVSDALEDLKSIGDDLKRGLDTLKSVK